MGCVAAHDVQPVQPAIVEVDEEADALNEGLTPMGDEVITNMGNSKTNIVKVANGYKVTSARGFPSVRGNFMLKRGAWYYEVQLMTDMCMQIGFADSKFAPDDINGQGVGDDLHSWAYDGWRLKKWHGPGGQNDYGGSTKWKVGDTVGCCVDIDAKTMKFYLNGNDLGTAFTNIKFQSSACYPAVSLQAAHTAAAYYGAMDAQSAVFVFDSQHFKYPLPSGYNAINSCEYFNRDMHVDAVNEWLSDIGLEKYYEAIKNEGYETKDDLNSLTYEDLTAMGVKQMHAKKILKKIANVNVNDKASEGGVDELPAYETANYQ